MRTDPFVLFIVVITIFLIIIYDYYNYELYISENIEHNTNIESNAETNSDNMIENEPEYSSSNIDNIYNIDNIDNINVGLNDSEITPDIDPNKLQIIVAGIGPEVRKLGDIESELSNIKVRQLINTNILEKLYEEDVLGDHMSQGWFVQVHNVISTPHGITLGAEIDRFYEIPRICFRAQNNFPFLGLPQDPMYLPKPSFIGFRAMTIFKIPKTGYYQFRVLSDDGSRLMYQITHPSVMIDEKNIRNTWIPLIDQWRFQAETWEYSQFLYFNQSDFVLLRFDYFQADGNSTACIKVRYSEVENPIDIDNPSDRFESDENFEDLNISDLNCSLLWTNVPLMGIR